MDNRTNTLRDRLIAKLKETHNAEEFERLLWQVPTKPLELNLWLDHYDIDSSEGT